MKTIYLGIAKTSVGDVFSKVEVSLPQTPNAQEREAVVYVL
jgi:hypothetical protein